MGKKIPYRQYEAMLLDINVDDEALAAYSIAERGDGAFDPVLKPNPELVDMSELEVEAENAMQIGNRIARWRRQQIFKRRVSEGVDLPILVSEGDSWFQFPILIKEVIDNLDDDYLIWSIGAAGDTAQNMVNNDIGRGKTEYMRALNRHKGKVRGFLFSAAGNDVIGEDPETKKPVLERLLKPMMPGITNPGDLVNQAEADKVYDFLDLAYRKVIGNVRSDPAFADLPIFIHGYDYTFPYPWGRNDPRDPIYAEKDQWLGKPLDRLGITDQKLRRGAIKVLIDQLYDRFGQVAAADRHVHLVDCRGALPDVSDWADEIHGTSRGFAKVAARFKATISGALAGA